MSSPCEEPWGSMNVIFFENTGRPHRPFSAVALAALPVCGGASCNQNQKKTAVHISQLQAIKISAVILGPNCGKIVVNLHHHTGGARGVQVLRQPPESHARPLGCQVPELRLHGLPHGVAAQVDYERID